MMTNDELKETLSTLETRRYQLQAESNDCIGSAGRFKFVVFSDGQVTEIRRASRWTTNGVIPVQSGRGLPRQLLPVFPMCHERAMVSFTMVLDYEQAAALSNQLSQHFHAIGEFINNGGWNLLNSCNQ